MNINSLLESANPWQSLQSDSARLVKKWEKSGLLEGLKGEIHRNNMAMMLENQAKQLVIETSLSGGGAGAATAGTFTPGVGEQWAGVALPLVRKVFGQIAAKEFVSVQPMNLPSGLVFFLDFQYGTNRTPFSTGDSMYGITSASNQDPNGGLYGAGRFGYSINPASGTLGFTTSSAVGWNELGFDQQYSASVAAGTYRRVTVGPFPANTDFEAVRSFMVISGSTVNASSILTQFTTTTATTNPFTGNPTAASCSFYVTASAFVGGAGQGTLAAFYSIQPLDYARGDFEDGRTDINPINNQISIPEINVQLRSQAIVAKTRKLKAQWTPEFAQDLNAYHSLDAEAELTSILSEYISLEIDLEILDMLIKNASTTEQWSAVNNIALDSTGASTSLGFYNTQGGWFQTLGTKLQKVSNKIHQKTLRGGANFMVISPTVATIIESIPGFAADTDGAADTMKYAFGVQKIGSLNSRYKVYKNPYMTENVILMGFRGTQFLETGAVYAPYIPLIMTPLVYDPNTFTPRKGIMTRYAKEMVRPEFYGKIFIAGLTTL